MTHIRAARYEIVLIGPVRAGKTTVGQLVADRLSLPTCSMDDVCQRYYKEVEESTRLECEKIKQEVKGSDVVRAFAAMAPLIAHAVERLFSDYRDCVFDMGAGHTVLEGEYMARIARVLDPFPNVILLTPSPSKYESVVILQERLSWPFQRELNETFVRHSANYDLAKRIIYTKGLTPGETCDEVVRKCLRSV
ncbi:MAG: shikimate kinase [Candidatus Eisenbacteria bacterium]